MSQSPEPPPNPYAPPQAETFVAAVATKPGIFWKIYLSLFTVGQFLYVGWFLIEPEFLDADWVDYVDVVIYTVVLAGLFGYVLQRRIARQNFWKIFFPLMAIWDGFSSFYLGLFDLSDAGGWVEYALTVGLTLLFMVPQYIAIYRYGYKAQPPWCVAESMGESN